MRCAAAMCSVAASSRQARNRSVQRTSLHATEYRDSVDERAGAAREAVDVGVRIAFVAACIVAAAAAEKAHDLLRSVERRAAMKQDLADHDVAVELAGSDVDRGRGMKDRALRRDRPAALRGADAPLRDRIEVRIAASLSAEQLDSIDDVAGP